MKEKKPSVLKNNIYFLKLLWGISPFYVISSLLCDAIHYAVWTFNSVVFVEYLFGDNVRKREFGEVVLFILLALLISVLRDVFFRWYHQIYLDKAKIKVYFRLNTKLFIKAQSVDLSCYENPEFYNSYTKAADEASNREFQVLYNCTGFVTGALSAAAVIIKMISITYWSIPFIVLPIISNFYLGKKTSKVSFDINEEKTPDNRILAYLNRIVYFRQYAGEMRLTNLYSLLKDMFKRSADSQERISLKHAGKMSFFEISKSLFMYVFGFEGMWLCAAILAVSGKISLGELTVLLGTIVSVSHMIRQVSGYYQGMSDNAFFIDNLKSFFAFVPKIDESASGKETPHSVETVEFKDVTFTYDGADKPALKNISLKLQKGTRYALVGINGSGKTTLIKLLMRFYDVDSGEILLNGTNIKEFDIKKYRSLIGAAFQDFALFAATVSENVLLRTPENEQERTAAVNALIDSDAYEKIKTLPQKEDTLLTKEFDKEGTELSGGEKQKLAIARAFVKNSPIVVLDEPSSALDPVAEHKMFETIMKLSAGENKLALIVSHRLSSAAMCEKVFVLEDGALIEQGSHKELLMSGGVYADMFSKQARNYNNVGGGEIEED